MLGSDHFFKAPWARLLLGLACATSAVGQVRPAAPSDMAMHHEHAAHAPANCADTALKCAVAVTPFFDAHGVLWIAWSAGGAVSAAKSQDAGKSFSTPILIGQHGAALDVGADARPQIVVDARGRVTVAYGVFKDQRYNAQVMVSTSADGASFSAPHPLSSQGASQRFPTLGVDTADDALFAVWLDKRTVAAARQKGIDQPGAALAYARSGDGGVSFGAGKIAQDHSCECCRLALAFDPQHRPVVLFRSIFGARERDHSVLTFATGAAPGTAYRVAFDRWEVDGCPHHGPALAVAADGSYQAAWFTLGQARQGLFYARSTDGGRTFSDPQAVGSLAQQAGRPQLLARGNAVWLVWKEFDGKRVFVKERHSQDSGLHWTADRVVGTTGAYADHPMLAADRLHVYLSWMTRDEGYRVIPLEEP